MHQIEPDPAGESAATEEGKAATGADNAASEPAVGVSGKGDSRGEPAITSPDAVEKINTAAPDSVKDDSDTVPEDSSTAAQDYEQLPDLGETSISQEELLGIVEALVFGAEEALSASRICDIIVDTTGERPTPDMIDDAVDWLNSVYEDGRRAFRIRTWGGGYRMATDPIYAPYLKAMYFQHRETKLSRSLLETLAILAYKQPTTKPEIDHIRGVDSDYAIRRLMELGFVEIGGRSESVGKPLLYKSTELFMDKFGLSSLEDLPTLREMEELLNDPSFSSEKAHLLMKRGLDLPDDGSEQLDLNLFLRAATPATIEIADPSEILSETADASSGDGAPPESDLDADLDTDMDRTNLSSGADSNPDVN